MRLGMLFCIGLPLLAQKLGTLQELLQPQMIQVEGNELFVVEDHQVFIYELTDLKLKCIIGAVGQGPGEFNLDPSRSLVISIHGPEIVAESRTKLVFFSRDGGFLRERKKNPGILQTIPIESGYVVLKMTFEGEGRQYFTVNLMDDDLESRRELYRQRFFSYQNTTYVIPDALHLCLFRDWILIEQSPEGPVVAAYDQGGRLVNRFHLEVPPIEVLDLHRERAFKEYMSIPFYRRMADEQGHTAVSQYVNQLDLVYPDNFPTIETVLSDEKYIYVKTHSRSDKWEEYLVLDSAGRRKRTLRLPAVKPASFLVRLQGEKNLFTFCNDTFYYLQSFEQDGEDLWALHAVGLS